MTTETAAPRAVIDQYTPARGYATIAARPDGVELGDVVDHTAGLMAVTEITRRAAVWTLGGYNPADPPPMYWTLGAKGTSAPPLGRDLTMQPRIRVRRPATAWSRLPGHTKTITSHNPAQRGMYTVVEGWTAACSCGWNAPEPAKSRGGAEDAVAAHRAQVLTDAAREDLPGLGVIEALEDELGDVLPWRWDHGAQAQLRGLTTAQALARLTPWARALGVDIEHMPGNPFPGDEHFLWVDSRSTETGPRLDIRAYPTDPDGT